MTDLRFLLLMLFPFFLIQTCLCQEPVKKLDHFFMKQGTYFFCMDGGGSKTILEVLDSQGRRLPLSQNGTEELLIQAGSTNINTVKIEGIKAI